VFEPAKFFLNRRDAEIQRKNSNKINLSASRRLGGSKIILALWLLMALLSHNVAAKDENKEVDYLTLAALLVKDGHYERAAVALDNLNTNDDKLDKQRYYTLQGLIQLKLAGYKEAIDAFQKALNAGQNDPTLHIYIAQAWYALEDYDLALTSITAAGEAAASNPGVVLMEAQIYWDREDPRNAWQVLSRGEARFAENPAFPRRKVFMLIQLGLYQEAAAHGLDYLQRFAADATDYIAIGSALRQSGQPNIALNILEPARIQFPENEKALIALALTYANLEEYSTAASLLEQAALRNHEYLSDAAELYQRAGFPMRALFLNERTTNQKKKYKQRLSLLLESSHYQQAVDMEEALYRVGLLDNEDIRYALAYAAFKVGNYDTVRRHLNILKRPALFKKATALRQTMATCESSPWQCY